MVSLDEKVGYDVEDGLLTGIGNLGSVSGPKGSIIQISDAIKKPFVEDSSV